MSGRSRSKTPAVIGKESKSPGKAGRQGSKASGQDGSRKKQEVRIVAKNRAALRRWKVEDTIEAGLVLTGTEVKAVREGKAQISDAYATIRSREVVLVNLHIGPYKAAGPHAQHEPGRPRKLLLRREQIERLIGSLERKGYSLVPLDIHFRGPWVKVELGLCVGKRAPDRREDIKKREADREVERAMRRR